MLYPVAPCNSLSYRAIPCLILQYHQHNVISCNKMQHHELPIIPCLISQYLAIPCRTMQYLSIACNTLQYPSIPYSVMHYHPITCNTRHRWLQLQLTESRTKSYPVRHSWSVTDNVWKCVKLIVFSLYSNLSATRLLRLKWRRTGGQLSVKAGHTPVCRSCAPKPPTVY